MYRLSNTSCSVQRPFNNEKNISRRSVLAVCRRVAERTFHLHLQKQYNTRRCVASASSLPASDMVSRADTDTKIYIILNSGVDDTPVDDADTFQFLFHFAVYFAMHPCSRRPRAFMHLSGACRSLLGKTGSRKSCSRVMENVCRCSLKQGLPATSHKGQTC